MKKKYLLKQFISFLILLLLANSCKKDDTENTDSNTQKNTGFSSAQDFKDNSYISNAIIQSGITINDGTNPPNIEGEYDTSPSSYYAACDVWTTLIGINLNTIVKYYNQSGLRISSSEKCPTVGSYYSEGVDGFITGCGNNFTVWMECLNNTGSTTAYVATGHKVNNNLVIRTVATYTANPPAGHQQGEWWASGFLFINLLNSSIGDNYQGGIIAYFFRPGDPGYDENNLHGIIVAPYDQSSGIEWYNGNYTTTGAISAALGGGASNTNAIVASQGQGNYAAKLCYDLVLGGYSDWYLPSKEELNKIYLNKNLIGGFNSTAHYWSSTEYNSSEAFKQTFSNGYQYNYYKNTDNCVRAIRYF